MNKLEAAQNLVRNGVIPDALVEFASDAYAWDGTYSGGISELTGESLAATFSYQIGLNDKRIDDENAVILGTSKYRGLPHLPRGMEWPQNLYFDSQINLTDLAEVDVSGRLPRSGMLYFFFNNRGDHAVVHWDGPAEELELREYPDASALADSKYYLADFLKARATLTFEPYWLCYLNHGDSTDYRDLRAELPDELVECVSKVLEAPFLEWDNSSRLYGRPHYWQGEDEGEMPVGFDDDGEPIWGEPREKLLLLQTELADASIHFWSDPKAAASGDFSQTWMGHSGT